MVRERVEQDISHDELSRAFVNIVPVTAQPLQIAIGKSKGFA
jgi:hypothetical protein